MNAIGIDSLGTAGLESEIVPLMSLLHNGTPESQSAYRLGVKWHPAGVLLEQLLADVTIVHSLPKCGGTTIAATLNAHPAIRPEALHLHYLSPKGLAFLEHQIAECSHPNVCYLQAQLAQGRGARALLAANRAIRTGGMSSLVRKPFLIAAVREPVALYLSLAFEGSSLVDATGSLSAEYLRYWVTSDPLGRVWDDWFIDELGAVSDVDVYARQFPTHRGWELYETDAARVIIVRQENLDRLPDALGALYGLPPTDFTVKNRNVAANKDYAEHYAKAKRALRLTDTELDEVYSSRFVQHFYTAKEIAGFKRRWRASGSENVPSLKQYRVRPCEPHALPPSRSEPTCGCVPTTSGDSVSEDSVPHPWVCRPCWVCAHQLQSIPHLHNLCAEQAAHIHQLKAQLARRWPTRIKNKLLSLLRRWKAGRDAPATSPASPNTLKPSAT